MGRGLVRDRRAFGLGVRGVVVGELVVVVEAWVGEIVGGEVVGVIVALVVVVVVVVGGVVFALALTRFFILP